MDIERLKSYVISRSTDELNSNYPYHCTDHIIMVYEATCELGLLENLTPYDLKLLKIAALLHDIGISISYNEHEEESVKIAEEILPSYGCSEEEIATISELIMATKMPQNPKGKLQEVICDADMFYLGRHIYFEISGKLRNEWESIGREYTDKEWHLFQLDFLKNHSFFTESAKLLQNKIKRKNLQKTIKVLKNSAFSFTALL